MFPFFFFLLPTGSAKLLVVSKGYLAKTFELLTGGEIDTACPLKGLERQMQKTVLTLLHFNRKVYQSNTFINVIWKVYKIEATKQDRGYDSFYELSPLNFIYVLVIFI